MGINSNRNSKRSRGSSERPQGSACSACYCSWSAGAIPATRNCRFTASEQPWAWLPALAVVLGHWIYGDPPPPPESFAQMIAEQVVARMPQPGRCDHHAGCGCNRGRTPTRGAITAAVDTHSVSEGTNPVAREASGGHDRQRVARHGGPLGRPARVWHLPYRVAAGYRPNLMEKTTSATRTSKVASRVHGVAPCRVRHSPGKCGSRRRRSRLSPEAVARRPRAFR